MGLLWSDFLAGAVARAKLEKGPIFPFPTICCVHVGIEQARSLRKEQFEAAHSSFTSDLWGGSRTMKNYLVFPERKMAKSSDSYINEKSKVIYTVTCALGFSLMFPASLKSDSPDHGGSKANGAAAKQSHEETVHATGNQK